MSTLMLYNGPIYTLDPAQPRVQAIAIRDGRVIAIGSEGKVQAAVGGRAEGVNLRGRAVIPALTDAHVHLVMHGLTRREIRLEGIDDLDVAHRLRQRLAPSVHSVATEKECMRGRMIGERRSNDLGQALHVLVVFEDRDPLPVLVRRHALESLQHLVPFDAQAAAREMLV